MEFGQRLKAVRKANKQTQVVLAKELGVTKSAITKYERGERVPDMKTLVKISDIYGVTLDYLVRGVTTTGLTEKQKKRAWQGLMNGTHFLLKEVNEGFDEWRKYYREGKKKGKKEPRSTWGRIEWLYFDYISAIGVMNAINGHEDLWENEEDMGKVIDGFTKRVKNVMEEENESKKTESP